jgi:PEP-CTERM motif-containing protein
MKKLAAVLCLSALTTGAFAQGLVSFINSSTTLSTYQPTVGSAAVATGGAAGSWYYGLLISSTPAGPFSFSGAYATNIAAAGRFFGGTSVAVTGWGAGLTESYEVAVWSASLGPTWKAGWLTGNFGGVSGNFGISSVATQVSGGAGSPASPPTPLFGGANGIQSGFNAPVTVPEPTSMALAGLGAAALLIFRRRK